MKQSLRFVLCTLTCLISLSFSVLHGQQVIFSEDFSGFTTGTHASPSTSDASGSLDTKTLIPGWTGYKIYPAGGEIKLGTASITGWIETPVIDFSGLDAGLKLEFDICCWPGDASEVIVFLNDQQLGDLIEPSEEYKKKVIPLTPGITNGKIRFEAQAKRFFLDNIEITSDEATYIRDISDSFVRNQLFPNPAKNIISLRNIEGCLSIEIADINGTKIKQIFLYDKGETCISVEDLPPSVYFVILQYPDYRIIRKFIKMP